MEKPVKNKHNDHVGVVCGLAGQKRERLLIQVNKNYDNAKSAVQNNKHPADAEILRKPPDENPGHILCGHDLPDRSGDGPVVGTFHD